MNRTDRMTGPGAADPIDPSTRFEHGDLNVYAVILVLLGVVLGTQLIAILVYPFFRLLREEPAVAARNVIPAPPEPRLEASPQLNLRQLRAAEDAVLNGYHWVDRAAGTVSIPIDQAIRIVAARGIPPQPSTGESYFPPQAGDLSTGFEGKVEPEP